MGIQLAIADDHQLFREGLRTIINAQSKHQVIIEASNGQLLIDQLKEKQVDVILMDLKMPVLDGIEATKLISKKFPDIKIIILSMHEDDKFILHMLEQGAKGYLLKNCDPKELVQAIETVQEQGYYFNDRVSRAMLGNINKKSKQKIRLKNVPNLTNREIQILKLICEGYTNAEIGQMIFLSTRTIEGHRQKLIDKTNAKNTAGLVAYAFRHGLVE